jgi:hypothetical protein
MRALAAQVARLEARYAVPELPPLPSDGVALAAAAGLALDGRQRRVVRSQARQLILNTSRQVGKSSAVAIKAVDTALRQPGSLVLLASPTLRQSGELFRKCMDTYRAAGRLVPSEAESALRLELEGGSRIVSLPGAETSVRGYSRVALLCLDEASRISDALYVALRPVLAVSQGQLIMLSTPAGKRGVFHREWTEGTSWERVEVPATACKRIPASFLASERASLPAALYDQEYCCAFVDLEGSVFAHEDIAAALSEDVAPLFPLVGLGA